MLILFGIVKISDIQYNTFMPIYTLRTPIISSIRAGVLFKYTKYVIF